MIESIRKISNIWRNCRTCVQMQQAQMATRAIDRVKPGRVRLKGTAISERTRIGDGYRQVAQRAFVDKMPTEDLAERSAAVHCCIFQCKCLCYQHGLENAI